MSSISPFPPPSSPPPPSVATSTTVVGSISEPSFQTPPTFQFPPIYSFPPFFTLQPNPTTRSSQLTSWSTLIQSYCRFHRIHTLSLVDALSTPLFSNTSISRALSLRDLRAIITWMASPEGGSRAEWISPGGPSKKSAKDEEAGRCWVYWRRPEEWAGVVEEWVERTGQKGTVLTLYEITESDATKKEEFHGMDAELLQRSLGVWVQRGKAQIFGQEGSEGVKFF